MAGQRDRVTGRVRRSRWGSAAGTAVVLLLALAALLLPAVAGATSLERLSVEQLAQRATLVAEGTVLSTTVDQTGGDVRTDVLLRVREALKGAPGDVATFSVPGGTLPDGTLVAVDAMPAFSPGDECYVFVDVRGWVIAGFQGKIAVVDGRVGGKGVKRASMSARIAAALRPGVAATAAAPSASPAPGARTAGSPTIASVSPSSASAGTGSSVVISGSGFGSREGLVEFSYGNDDVERIEARVSSWSDRRIECTVPTGTIKGYAASAGSGPMWVTTAAGTESLPFDFSVPFGYGDERWLTPRVTYYVNTSGIDDTLRETLVDAGTATWNAAGSGFTFVDGGRTTAGLARDGKSVISWANGMPDGVIALSSSSSRGGFLTEADIRYSNAYVWGDGAKGSDTMDIQSIATHEVGHWLVLLDLYGSGDEDKVMYGFGAEEWVVRNLTPGDVAGIKWIYPVDTQAPDVGARSATAKRSQTVKIYFRVYDALSAQVAAKVQLKNGAGAVKKTWSYDFGENYDGWWWVRYKAALPKGRYQIVVTGTDLAGNSATATATLTVK